MKVKLLFLIAVICLCVSGCAQQNSRESNIPAWDDRTPLDESSSATPSFSDKLSNIISGGNSEYHFRKVRWGFTRERVMLSEAGNTITENRGNALVYKCKLNGVYCKLIYTFKDNRLRTAGYVTQTPVPNADNLIKSAVDKHGMPDTHTSDPNNGEEMVWKTSDTVIYANLYASVTKRTMTKYDYSSGGLLKNLIQEGLEERNPGEIRYWDGVYSHVDMAFFRELHEESFPLETLSFYEKLLAGIVKRRKRTNIPGLGTIPGSLP